MKYKGILCRIFLCFVIAALLLTSCKESEKNESHVDKSEEKSAVDSTEKSEEISINVSQNSEASIEEIENSSFNSLAEDVEALPPDGVEILYGNSDVPTIIEEPVLSGGFDIHGDSIKQYLENSDYDGAYYYVCLDTRITYSPLLTIEEEINYYKSFGIAVERVCDVYFAYVTKEQINSLDSDSGHIPYTKLIWVNETAKDKYKAEIEK